MIPRAHISAGVVQRLINETKDKDSTTDNLQIRHGYWQQRAFGDSLTDQGLINHMKREILEIEKATRNEEIEEECADLLLLLLGLAHKKGFSLIEAAEAKFAKVQGRTWKQPDAEGVIEHVREPK